MKKTLCMLLITAMLLSVMPMMVFAATPEGEAITTAEQLYNMEDNKKYYLAEDITITQENSIYFKDKEEGGGYAYGVGWKYRSPLDGTTLDGNGKTIYYADGLTIYAGLFSEVKGITVKNLNIVASDNVTYKGLGGEVSPLVRRVVGGTVTITDVNVYANIEMTSDNGANQGGGIVSQVIRSSTLRLTRCVFSGSITKNYTVSKDNAKGVAGMVGGNYIHSDGTADAMRIYMEECINYADITNVGLGAASGFFGKSRNNETSSDEGIREFVIKNCINYGDITGGEDAGGFIGYLNLNPSTVNTFKYNINYGDVEGTYSTSRAGGFVAYLCMQSNSSCTMHGFINFGELSAKTNVDDAVGNLIFKGSGHNRDNNTNYTHQSYGKHSSGDSGSGADLIKDVAAACNTLNARMNAGGGYYVLLANGKLGLVWANNAGYDEQAPNYIDATLIGVQLSGTAQDQSRNVRFVCGLEGITGLSEVGVKIIAKDANGNTLKEFEGTTNKVYESILAGGEDIYAKEYGKTYFYTAVIEGVPTSVGEITFEVHAFETTTNGTIYGIDQTVNVNMAA